MEHLALKAASACESVLKRHVPLPAFGLPAGEP
jgi:hypothetical protein